MLYGPPMDFTITLRLEQRECLPNGDWTAWHPLDLNDAQNGLAVGQRFQRRVNGKTTGVMIYHDTPGVKFQLDYELAAP